MADSYLNKAGLIRLWGKITALVGGLKYAGSATTGGPATKAVSIPTGTVNAASTSTVFTATVDGITELRDGVCMMLTNGVVTSASGWTLNVNSLGAKPVYSSLSEQNRITDTFDISNTRLFIYNSARVSGGCWDMCIGSNEDRVTVCLHLTESAFSSLPHTISHPDITGDMRVVEATWGNPSAIKSDITWVVSDGDGTSDGTIVLSGSMLGSTTVDLVLARTGPLLSSFIGNLSYTTVYTW